MKFSVLLGMDKLNGVYDLLDSMNIGLASVASCKIFNVIKKKS